MSKQPNIRWTRSDYSKLSHLVRKVNSKILDVEVKRPDIADLQPQMLDYQEIKSQIKTRREYKNLIKKYERYLREGAENEVKTDKGGRLTEWQKNEIRIFDLTENAKKSRTRKKLGSKEVTIAGEGTGQTRSQMGSIKENATKSRVHNVKNMSQKDIEKLLALMDKKFRSSYDDEQRRRVLENYIRGLINVGYDDELLEMLNHIDVNDFIELLDTDEVGSFDFIYDPIELQAKTEKLKELWSNHVNININNNIDFNRIRESIEELDV